MLLVFEGNKLCDNYTAYKKLKVKKRIDYL